MTAVARFSPPGPSLRVRYRYNGIEKEFWPVTEEEALTVMNPGATYGFSIGSAFSQIIAAHKSGRTVKSGERQETVKQRKRSSRNRPEVVGMSTDVKFFLGYIFGSILTLVIQDWLAETA